MSIVGRSNLLRLPSLFDCKRILCVQPHPDDMDIGWGGTVAALAAHGVEVIYLSVTDDAAGLVGDEAKLPYPQRVAMRRREQEVAAETLGVSETLWLEYPDAGDWRIQDARNAIVDVIRRLSPDAVATVDPWLPYEAHRDHSKCGLAASEAIILSTFPAIGTHSVPRDLKVEAAIYVFTSRPNTSVETTEFRGLKLEAIAAHRSQFESDSLEQLFAIDEARSRDLGSQTGAEYAEACKVLDPLALHIFPEAAQS